jgi:hypothetical protein
MIVANPKSTMFPASHAGGVNFCVLVSTRRRLKTLLETHLHQYVRRDFEQNLMKSAG